jgi:hypothetical protein
MAKFFHSKLFDFGIQSIIPSVGDPAVQLHVIKNYSIGDSYATVLSNTLGHYTPASSEFTLSYLYYNISPTNDPVYDYRGYTLYSNSNRTCTVPAFSIVSEASATSLDNLHIAILDPYNSFVIVVTDEITNQNISVGMYVNVPSFTIYSGLSF